MSTKLLYLLRHAKAESANAKLSDEDRPLTERGIGDVKKLANKLQKKELNFDVIVTSPAIRAITTAQIIAKTLDHRQHHLEVEKKIYQASFELKTSIPLFLIQYFLENSVTRRFEIMAERAAQQHMSINAVCKKFIPL